MKVLVVGKGGREHALCWRLARSPSVKRVYCAPGNPGIAQVATTVPIQGSDIAALADYAEQEKIDLAVVGPEEPLALGIVDAFERRGLRIFGPSRTAANLEASKSFAKAVMREAGVPTADYEVFDSFEAARRWLLSRRGAAVVKADGLALGKGVFVCADAAEAIDAASRLMKRRELGSAGEKILVEERLSGRELSFFALCDGRRAVPLAAARDYKRALDGDGGSNTGGMGAYSPVPGADAALEARIMREIVNPVVVAMAERGVPYRGVLYVGLMITDRGPYVLEFNVRFGDPECEALMMRFEGDLAETLLAAAEQRLDKLSMTFSGAVTAVVLASGGYPSGYARGLPIRGIEEAARVEGVEIFHAGTALHQPGHFVTDGGRVLVVAGYGETVAQAHERAYRAARLIEFDGRHMRTDIAAEALSLTDSHGEKQLP